MALESLSRDRLIRGGALAIRGLLHEEDPVEISRVGAVPGHRFPQPGSATARGVERSRPFANLALLLFFACLAGLLAHSSGGRFDAPGMLPSGFRSSTGGVERFRNGPVGPEQDVMRFDARSSAAVLVSVFASGAVAQGPAEQWRISDGGNGNWYEVVVTVEGGHLNWTQARDAAIARGGHLVYLDASGEANYCFQLSIAKPNAWRSALSASSLGPWVGGRQAVSASEPNGGWTWDDGRPIDLVLCKANFNNSNNCSGGANEDRMTFWADASTPTSTTPFITSDFPERGTCETNVGPVRSYIIEWDADCNGDGVVDYGQIASGELEDINANWIPDCCESGRCSMVSNGSFEAGTPLNPCTAETIAASNPLGGGWMVASGSVQRTRAIASCGSQGTPKFGDFFVDLLDSGEIRQAIATAPGRSYRLVFWLSGDCAGGVTTKRVTASLGSATQNFDHVCTGTGLQAWRSCSLEFIANSAITTLSLKSVAGGASNGPLVDGVRVEDISISCPGDVDGDGAVTGGDIGLVLLNFGNCPQ